MYDLVGVIHSFNLNRPQQTRIFVKEQLDFFI